MKDLREETYDLTSDLKEDISTLQKKVDILNVKFYDINQYKRGDGLVNSYLWRDYSAWYTNQKLLLRYYSQFILASPKNEFS